MGVTQCTSGNTPSSAFLAAGLAGGVHDNLSLAAPLYCAVLPGPRPSEMMQQGSGQGLPGHNLSVNEASSAWRPDADPNRPAADEPCLIVPIARRVCLSSFTRRFSWPGPRVKERGMEKERERGKERKVGRGGGTSSQRSKQRSRGERMGQGIQEAVLHDLPAVVSQGVFPASPCCFAGAFPCVSHRNVTLIWALISEAELPCQPCRDGYIAATLFLKICQWWQQVMDDKSSAAFGRLTKRD